MGKRIRVALHARVSTDEQSTTNQLRELRQWAERAGHDVVAEYVDRGISGAKGRDKRPQFDALLKVATQREFDMVAAWIVDGLGHSLQDLVGFLNEIHQHKVDLFVHEEEMDTSTPAGKALLQMCGVVAEFEREIIRERIHSVIKRARVNGTRSGRPFGRPRSEPHVEARIRALRKKQGHSAHW